MIGRVGTALVGVAVLLSGCVVRSSPRSAPSPIGCPATERGSAVVATGSSSVTKALVRVDFCPLRLTPVASGLAVASVHGGGGGTYVVTGNSGGTSGSVTNGRSTSSGFIRVESDRPDELLRITVGGEPRRVAGFGADTNVSYADIDEDGNIVYSYAPFIDGEEHPRVSAWDRRTRTHRTLVHDERFVVAATWAPRGGYAWLTKTDRGLTVSLAADGAAKKPARTVIPFEREPVGPFTLDHGKDHIAVSVAGFGPSDGPTYLFDAARLDAPPMVLAEWSALSWSPDGRRLLVFQDDVLGIADPPFVSVTPLGRLGEAIWNGAWLD